MSANLRSHIILSMDIPETPNGFSKSDTSYVLGSASDFIPYNNKPFGHDLFNNGFNFDHIDNPLKGNVNGDMWIPNSIRESLLEKPISITVADLSPKEILDARRDPKVKAIAEPMPLQLIEPVQKRESNINTGVESSSWGIEAVNAHKSKYNGDGIKVAILDTGINSQHLAFQDTKLTLHNFTKDSDYDTNGHGTHCAGTVFGKNVNGLRIGIASGISEALIGKVIGYGGTSASLVEAIQWAYKEGAHVISMSLGIDYSTFVNNLIQSGYNPQAAASHALNQYLASVNLFSSLTNYIKMMEPFNGQPCLVVAASGNSSSRPKYDISASVPATSEDIISVGALMRKGRKYSIADFSNSNCTLSAPGVNITSAWIDGADSLKSLDGTSMAAPHVTGCAALWAQKLQQDNSFNSLLFRNSLLGKVRSIPNIEVNDIGNGMVQCPL